jgi:hypothetical protein
VVVRRADELRRNNLPLCLEPAFLGRSLLADAEQADDLPRLPIDVPEQELDILLHLARIVER